MLSRQRAPYTDINIRATNHSNPDGSSDDTNRVLWPSSWGVRMTSVSPVIPRSLTIPWIARAPEDTSTALLYTHRQGFVYPGNILSSREREAVVTTQRPENQVPSSLSDRLAANTTPSRLSRQLSERGVLPGGRHSNGEDDTATASLHIVGHGHLTKPSHSSS